MTNSHSNRLTTVQQRVLKYIEKKGVAYPSEISKDLLLRYEEVLIPALQGLQRSRLVEFGPDDFSVHSVREKNFP
jgi:hypothetical protein